MSKVVLNDVVSAHNVSVINENFNKIEEALNEKILYRENPVGELNEMNNNLDMNGNRIYNLPAPSTLSEPARLQDILDFAQGEGSYASVIRVPLDESIPELPAAASRANKLLSFDAGGNPIVSAPVGGDATTLALDLADTTVGTKGAGMVGYNTAHTYPVGTVGAAITALEDEVTARPQGVNVLDFIPEAEHATIRLGTSTYDCRANIQAAIDSLGPRGGRVFIPRGTYEMTDTAQRCLLISAPIILEGEGYFTCLKPKASVNALTNTIQVAPNPLIDCSHVTIERLHLGDPNNGLRNGNNGIFLDTQVVNAFLPQLKIRDCFIGQGSGYAIAHLNNPTNNVNGGMYASTIMDNQLRGGIRLDATGDSINIYRNVISGNNVGIYASLINGASQLHIIGNNITSVGGAIEIAQGARVQIIGNNIEQRDPIAGLNALSMINLSGSNGLVVQPVIMGNNLGAFTATGIIRAIRCASGEGGLIQDNSFLPSSNTQFGIAVFGAWRDLRIGWNQYGTDSLNRVSDSGIGTMGVARNYSSILQNGWVTEGSGSFADTTYMKDGEGYVTVQGAIKSGTIGTIGAPVILFTLPEDYRPAKSIHIPVYSQDTVPAVVPGNILVSAASGNVIMVNGSNGILSLNLRFLAAKAAGSNINTLGYGAGHTSNL